MAHDDERDETAKLNLNDNEETEKLNVNDENTTEILNGEATSVWPGSAAGSGSAAGYDATQSQPTMPYSSSDDRSGEPASVPETKRKPAAFGTIFWGVVLLIFAAVMIITSIPTIVIDTMTLVTVVLVAAGVLLVVAGIAAAIRRG
ncbi:hypothetical protein SAMN04489806_1717 [Paramicrobacterium humi]|uniref:Uncharacterized protein n=1 Tax=Paramicrobacterium humi TaxID=640635 RepID=A0A1H4M1Z8_9MICO|nr:hypothetical protein [Microbacterium humi]SEB76442.1 hypothetical protein SAMN04489806_1717 [Microbacterium humi]